MESALESTWQLGSPHVDDILSHLRIREMTIMRHEMLNDISMACDLLHWRAAVPPKRRVLSSGCSTDTRWNDCIIRCKTTITRRKRHSHLLCCNDETEYLNTSVFWHSHTDKAQRFQVIIVETSEAITVRKVMLSSAAEVIYVILTAEAGRIAPLTQDSVRSIDPWAGQDSPHQTNKGASN